MGVEGGEWNERVVLFVVMVARVWWRASARDGDNGALCVSGKGMVGLKGVRCVNVPGRWFFVFFGFLFCFTLPLFCSLLVFSFSLSDARDRKAYTTILRFGKGIVRGDIDLRRKGHHKFG